MDWGQSGSPDSRFASGALIILGIAFVFAYSGEEEARNKRLLNARVKPMLFSEELVLRLMFAIVWKPAVP